MYSDRQTRTFHRELERSFFHAAMQANVFSIEKTHQDIILFWQEIHSFVDINVATKHPRALTCVYNRIGRTHFGNCQR